jgi:hypothetical protein
VTLHVPDDNVQLAGLKVPVLFVVKVTVPVGVPEPEVTVAVQVVATLSNTLAGEQDTVVVVAKRTWVTARVNVPLLPV